MRSCAFAQKAKFYALKMLKNKISRIQKLPSWQHCLYNLNRVECHCLLYKFSWTDKIRADNLVCDFKGTCPAEG